MDSIEPFFLEVDGRDLLKMYEEEAKRQKKELEKWKLRSEVILQLAGNPISQTIDVNSDIGSNRSSSVSFGTCFSDFEDDILENTELVFQAISEEELEKVTAEIAEEDSKK